MDQPQGNARLIHYAGAPRFVCKRKDDRTDAIERHTERGTVVETATTREPSLVTCPTCREHISENMRRPQSTTEREP